MTLQPEEKVRAALLAAADLLEVPNAWTKRAAARDFAGQIVEPTSAAACCWCICGAVDRVLPDFPGVTYEMATEALGGDQRAILVNDRPSASQAHVVAFIRSRAR